MAGPKVRWTPARIERLRKLAGTASAYEIAHHLDTTHGNICQVAAMNGISLRRTKRMLRLVLQEQHRNRFMVESLKRNMHPEELARAIVTAVIEDNIFGAVLDE